MVPKKAYQGIQGVQRELVEVRPTTQSRGAKVASPPPNPQIGRKRRSVGVLIGTCGASSSGKKTTGAAAKNMSGMDPTLRDIYRMFDKKIGVRGRTSEPVKHGRTSRDRLSNKVKSRHGERVRSF